MFKEVKITIEDDKWAVEAEVELEYEEVDTSFDHAFGTERQSQLELAEAVVLSVRHMDTNEHVSGELLPKELVDAIHQKAHIEYSDYRP